MALLSKKNLGLLKTDEFLLRMDKETVNVGRIKPRYLYCSTVALGLSRFVRSGKDQQANKALPLLASRRLLEMNEPFQRMDELLLRITKTLLRITKPLLSETKPLLWKTKYFGINIIRSKSSLTKNVGALFIVSYFIVPWHKPFCYSVESANRYVFFPVVVLPYISHIGMCRPIGEDFCAVLV